jgi:hypothetical protein
MPNIGTSSFCKSIIQIKKGVGLKENKKGNFSTAEDRGGWVDHRGWDRKTPEKCRETFFKKSATRIGSYPCKILFINDQISYIQIFIRLPGFEEICFQDVVVAIVSALKG